MSATEESIPGYPGQAPAAAKPPKKQTGRQLFWSQNRRGLIVSLLLAMAMLTLATAYRKTQTDLAIALALATLAVAILSAVWFVPRAQIAWLPGSSDLATDRRQELEDKARATLAQAIGGTFFLATGFFTWRGMANQAEQASNSLKNTRESQQKQFEISTRGQMTDRYQKAVAMLKNNGTQPGDLTERLGGVYALESIARESPQDHGTIVEMLAAYIRQKSPVSGKARIPEDIQASLMVLARRSLNRITHEERGPIVLQDTNLRGAVLAGANFSEIGLENSALSYVIFWKAHLERVKMRGATIDGCEFTGAYLDRAHMYQVSAVNNRATFLQAVGVAVNLNEARLPNANMEQCELPRSVFFKANLDNADLMSAELQDCDFTQASMRKTYLSRTDCRGANFARAEMKGAVLTGADLSTAQGLTQAQIDTTVCDRLTKLPPGLHLPPIP